MPGRTLALRCALAGACIALLLATGVAAGKTKKLTGKIRNFADKVLLIEKSGMTSESYVEILLDEKTKVTGQLRAGLHVTVKYREEGEKDTKGERWKVAVEIATRPEYASKDAKKAAQHVNDKRQ